VLKVELELGMPFVRDANLQGRDKAHVRNFQESHEATDTRSRHDMGGTSCFGISHPVTIQLNGLEVFATSHKKTIGMNREEFLGEKSVIVL
jgi:hypothetical protein